MWCYHPLRGLGAFWLAGNSLELVSAVSEASETSKMSGRAHINIPRERIADLCRRSHIRKLALFGSVLTDRFRPDSDVDVLVEFEPGHTPGFAFCEIASELSDILGREVDLHTPNSLSRYFRDQVLAGAQVEYAA